MKNIILTITLIVAVQAFPQGEELRFKNVYVKPRVPISDNVLPRILNGHEVVPHSIPYQAYLLITDNDGDRWMCGGSLISQRYVLTAAHCVVDSISADVYLGAHNTREAEITRTQITSTDLRAHERFNGYFLSNDIALIGLPEPVELNNNINVVALPHHGDNTNYEGDNVRISGWGLTDGKGEHVSPTLQEVNSTVISNRQCDRTYGIVERSQLCTSGADGVGSCNGDSGGPLVDGNVQIGIVSYSVEYCEQGYPSGFTRISSYLDWIERHTDLDLK